MKYRDREWFSRELRKATDVLDTFLKVKRALWGYPDQDALGNMYHYFGAPRVDLYLATDHKKHLHPITVHLARELGVSFRSHQFSDEEAAMRMIGFLNGVEIHIEGGLLDACQMVEVPVTLPAQEALPERIEMKQRLVCPDKPLVIDESGQWKVKESHP